MRSFNRSMCFAILVCTILAAARANAATVAYEGFDYAPGTDLLDKAGGSGFSTPWTAGGFNATSHTNYDIASGSLEYPPLQTSGNSVTTDAVNNAIAGLTRTFSTPLGADGTTAYLSVLLRPEDTLGGGVFNGFFGIYLDGNGPLSEPDLFIGKPGGGAVNNYVIEPRGGGPEQMDTGDAAVINETSLLVLKAEFRTGADLFTLYVNPTPGGAEPSTGGTVLSSLDLGIVTGLAIYSTGAFSIDEIRVGPTFADVTPVVPLPSAAIGGMALLGTFAAARLARRRRPTR